MNIELRVAPNAARRWLAGLGRRLGPDRRVTAVRHGPDHALPSSLDLLLSLERLVYRLSGDRAGDRVALHDIETDGHAGRPDICLDLGADEGPPPNGTRTLRPLYDGTAGELALFAALVSGRMPVVEIADASTGAVLARGTPCADNAGTLVEAHEAVLARLPTLIESAIGGGAPLGSASRTPARYSTPATAGQMLRRITFSSVRALYRLCCHAPHWRIGWRFVKDADVWDRKDLEGIPWNTLPDPGVRFFADPFPFVRDGRHFVFFEDLDHRTNKGVISVVAFDESGPAGPARPVLEEPWHLSYPFLIEQAGEVWMIPEGSANATVDLYRADRFPDRWVKEATLLSGIEASDATIVAHGGKLWMFAATRDGAGSWSDTLSLFSATRLTGPWEPHPANPVLIDQCGARPAGNIVRRAGKLWRPVQDCSRGYGTGVGLAEILRLDEAGYEQAVRTVIRNGPGWEGRRFHTLNRAGALEVIDGSAHSPKSRLLSRRMESWSGRRESAA